MKKQRMKHSRLKKKFCIHSYKFHSLDDGFPPVPWYECTKCGKLKMGG